MLATMTIAYVLPAIYQRVPIFGPVIVGPDNCYHHNAPQARFPPLSSASILDFRRRSLPSVLASGGLRNLIPESPLTCCWARKGKVEHHDVQRWLLCLSSTFDVAGRGSMGATFMRTHEESKPLVVAGHCWRCAATQLPPDIEYRPSSGRASAPQASASWRRGQFKVAGSKLRHLYPAVCSFITPRQHHLIE